MDDGAVAIQSLNVCWRFRQIIAGAFVYLWAFDTFDGVSPLMVCGKIGKRIECNETLSNVDELMGC